MQRWTVDGASDCAAYALLKVELLRRTFEGNGPIAAPGNATSDVALEAKAGAGANAAAAPGSH